jgi:hypothetical protein
MGMQGILLALSPERLAMIDDDPDLLVEVIDARRQERIPGLLELGKAWHALDLLLGEELGDAILARSGRRFGPELGLGRGRLLEPSRVVELARALDGLPASLVTDRYPTLRGRNAHGGYGARDQEASETEYDDELRALGLDADLEGDAERDELGRRFEAVRAHYRTAAEKGHAVYAVVV